MTGAALGRRLARAGTFAGLCVALLAGRARAADTQWWTSNSQATEIGLRTLRWLADVQRAPAGHFRPIGQSLQWA